MTRHDYAFQIFFSYLRIFARHKKRAREGRGVEPLHQIRVTARRLRNALRIFKDVFPQKKLMTWKNGLRRLARVSSTARDWDIQIVFLGSFKRQPTPQKFLPGILQLQERLKTRRQRVQPQIIRALDRLEKSQTLEQLKGFLKKDDSDSSISSLPEPFNREKKARDIRDFAKKRIVKKLKKIFNYESYVDRPECSEELHQLRIAAKHFSVSKHTKAHKIVDRLSPAICDILLTNNRRPDSNFFWTRSSHNTSAMWQSTHRSHAAFLRRPESTVPIRCKE